MSPAILAIMVTLILIIIHRKKIMRTGRQCLRCRHREINKRKECINIKSSFPCEGVVFATPARLHHSGGDYTNFHGFFLPRITQFPRIIFTVNKQIFAIHDCPFTIHTESFNLKQKKLSFLPRIKIIICYKKK